MNETTSIPLSNTSGSICSSRKRIRQTVAIAALILTWAGAGCSSLQPIGPGGVHDLKHDEARLWKAADAEVRNYEQTGQVYQSPEACAYIQTVMNRLLKNRPGDYAPLSFRVRVFDSPVPNAFCMPQGEIFVHTGLLSEVRNEAQLAMLLGHEITHATHRHSYQESSASNSGRAALAYTMVVSQAVRGPVSSAIQKMGPIITEAAIKGYSRDKEREADRVGLELMAEAGYDPHAGPELFNCLLGASGEEKGNYLYAVHPRLKERLESTRSLAANLPPHLTPPSHETGQDRYVAVVGPIISEGIRRHIAEGKFEVAAQTLAFMQSARPDDAQLLVLSGDLIRARGDANNYGQAREAYEAALAKDEACAAAHRGLGLICFKQKERPQAAEHFRRYLELSPDATDASYIRQCVEQTENQK